MPKLRYSESVESKRVSLYTACMKQQKTITVSEDILRKIFSEELRKELGEELKNYSTRYELDSKLEKLKREIDDNAREYRDQILTKMDAIVGDYDQMREDNIFRDKEIKNLQEKVDQHDREIAHLKHS